MRRLQTLLTLAGTTGIVLLFVPFAYSVVPVSDVLLGSFSLEPGFWLPALPVIVLPLPITLSWALSLTGRPPRWAVASGYLLAAASAGCVLVAVAIGADGGTLLPLGLFGLAYAGAAWFSSASRQDAGTASGAIAMQAAYLVPAVMWLGGFLFDEADIGAYLMLVTAVVYAIQMTLAVGRRRLVLAALLPAAALLVVALFGE